MNEPARKQKRRTHFVQIPVRLVQQIMGKKNPKGRHEAIASSGPSARKAQEANSGTSRAFRAGA